MNTPSILEELWSKYNEVRMKGLKKEANRILSDVIRSFHIQDEREQKRFVRGICSQLLDTLCDSRGYGWMLFNNGIGVSEAEIRIQHPLFREVVLPILLEGYRENDPQSMRWIAQMFQFLYSDKPLWAEVSRKLEIDGWADPWFFLQRSYSISPNPGTLHMMLESLFEGMRYSCHELPCGILCEYEAFDQEIAELKSWLAKASSDVRIHYADAMAFYEEMAKHWRLYSKQANQQREFAEYMTDQGIDWRMRNRRGDV